ncbi:MAG: hypothetical protein R3D00_11935 [Bacteroidia bacterium]
MNITIGSNNFDLVDIPLLWGTRAILVDKEGRLSIIDLSGVEAKLEILGDRPAPDIEYYPNSDGFIIKKNGNELYHFDPKQKIISSISVGHLPTCKIFSNAIMIGENVFSTNTILGASVGLSVTEDGVSMGASLPTNLTRLKLWA